MQITKRDFLKRLGIGGVGLVGGAALGDKYVKMDGRLPPGAIGDPAHLAVVKDVLREVTLNAYVAPKAGGACAGLTFVITGDVHHWPNRAALKAYIEGTGGKVAGSVSKATSFLINNDVASTSGKNKKAQELGIPVISEDDFRTRFGG